jgi:hypothetical protein
MILSDGVHLLPFLDFNHFNSHANCDFEIINLQGGFQSRSVSETYSIAIS